jgi:uncharacterized protein
LTVAIAESLDQRSQGLRDLEALPDGLDGMIFAFGEERSATFGMEDTLIPLDIWWFDGDGRLLGSTAMEPCPETPCPSYPSPGEVSWALETPAGERRFSSGAVLAPPA